MAKSKCICLISMTIYMYHISISPLEAHTLVSCLPWLLDASVWMIHSFSYIHTCIRIIYAGVLNMVTCVLYCYKRSINCRSCTERNSEFFSHYDVHCNKTKTPFLQNWEITSASILYLKILMDVVFIFFLSARDN